MIDSLEYFINDITVLLNKYGKTLVDINDEINQTEKSLCEMIDDLSGSEFDMMGLEDFKSLIGG